MPHILPICRSALTSFGIAALLTIPAMGQRSPQSAPPDIPPDELVVPAGTVLTVEVRDYLSSNKNSPGDSFVGMLRQPLVVDGWVVARPGQTVMGQVISANNAGRVKGTSDLAIELTEMVLVDGHQAPILTKMVKSSGGESHKEDATAIAGVAALGTVIGAAVGGGKGALIGAGIGAGAATAGVLSTRGKAAEVYPEGTLAFRLDAPLVVSTVRSQQAFAPVIADDYDSAPALRSPSRRGNRDREAYEPYPPYPPDYDRYPRFPGSGPRIGVIPAVILFPPAIIINHRDHGRHH